MGEPGSGHQFRHPHTVIAAFTKQGGGRLDDVRSIRLCLRFGDSHTHMPLLNLLTVRRSIYIDVNHNQSY
ncbi:hypothetical protein D3C84_1124290 [compost metagenome]